MQVPKKKPKKKRRLGKAENGLPRKRASKPNEVWSYDFLFETTEEAELPPFLVAPEETPEVEE